MTQTAVRSFALDARSTDVFGRVLVNARHHHFVIDGPAQNGCPGEALTPPESFLAGVLGCGVELVQVIAREQGVPLARVTAHLEATLDRSNQPRADVTLFNRVVLSFVLAGVSEADAAALVGAFKKR
jgi:uncharacterized OsmC-like protein